MPKTGGGHDPGDRSWVAGWLAKKMLERHIGPADLGRQVGVSSQRISQITAGTDPPSTELLWKLAAALDGDEEYAGMAPEHVRGVLECLIVSVSPRRLFYLWDLDFEEARELISAHAVRRPLGPSRGQKWPPKKSSKES